MRSRNKPKKSKISAVLKKSHLGIFFIACCISYCLNFGLRAETLVSNSTNPKFNLSIINAPRTKIYFYNPEINTVRNLVLKKTWDSYLEDFGLYEFQPIDDVEDFKSLLDQKDDAAFIMAEWFYSSLFSNHGKEVELAFKGLLNGQETYQKILVSQNDSLNLEKVTIACSGTSNRAREVLKSIYPELTSQKIDKIKILLVPKDIDALMAVGYGLADMAITTEASISKMLLLNEHVYKDMLVIKQSAPLRRSVLVFKSSNNELKADLARALMDMSNHAKGKQAINLIGLDEWKLVNDLSTYLSKKSMDVNNKNGGLNNDK